MPEETAPQALGADHFMQMAHNYQVPVSEGTIQQIVGDNATPEKAKSFEDYLKTSAQGLYPSFAPQIAAGIPTAFLLDPYRQTAKQMLGENFEPNFLNDAKASAALTGGQDEKTGRPIPMSLDQWRSHIMAEPGFGWGYTKDAHERVNTMLANLKSGLEK
jgi:hypothetical protein